MKVGIVGAGAVGGYFGGLLVRSGFDVHFLLNSDFDHVNVNGLVVESKNGNFILESVNAYSCSIDMPECDVVIVALKTTQNYLLKSILPDILKKDGIVVALQNGLGVEKEIAGIVPFAMVMGGLCFLCSAKVGPGHIRHLDYGSIRLGQYVNDKQAGGLTTALETIARIFTQAKIPVQLAENLDRARWEKLVWNMGFNGPSVILDATTDRIIGDISSRRMVTEIMREVIHGARACGCDIDDSFAEKMLNVTQQMVNFSPSMKFDFQARRPLEIEHIYWRPIHAAGKKGVDMQKSRVLAYQLEYLDRNNRSEG